MHQRKFRLVPFSLKMICVVTLLTIFAIFYMLMNSQNGLNFSFFTRQELNYQLELTTDLFIVQPYKTASELKLPNLTAIKWPAEEFSKYPVGMKYANGTRMPLPGYFEPYSSCAQRKLIRKLLEVFSNSMFARGLGNRFMIYGGTLLGSIRHHDLIPWNDDIDVLVDLEIREEMQHTLRQLEPHFVLKTGPNRNSLFARFINESLDSEDLNYSSKAYKFTYGWPFLDIGFFARNSTHIYEIATYFGERYVWPIDMVFPLYFRPFGKFWYPAPRNSVQFTRMTYKLSSVCTSLRFSHVLKSNARRRGKPCHQLHSRYAFVRHKPCVELSVHSSDSRMTMGEETLYLKSSSGINIDIHKIQLPVDKENSLVDSYSLDNL